MPKKFVQKGKVKKQHQEGARDSSLRQSFLSNKYYEVKVGYIESVQSEPLNINTRVTLSSYYTNEQLKNVAFPGASVSTDQTGSLGASVKGLHGFYEGAVEGKMVSFAFINGNNQNPIVLNSYPYIATKKPGTEDNYVSPLTKKNFDPQDVFMSHFTGSYIVLNSKLPIPGTIQAYSKGRFLIESEIDLEVLARTNILLDANASINLKATDITLELITGHKLSLSSTGLKYEDPIGNEFEFGTSQAKFLINGIETSISASGVVSDMDVVGGDATTPISLLTHGHLGNLAFRTGNSIP